MKNGLYSIHMHMLDGVKGRDSGVLILRDGVLLGGGPHFWSIGSYTVGNGTWKGQLSTDQHTGFADRFVRPLFAGEAVASRVDGVRERAVAAGTTRIARDRLAREPRGIVVSVRRFSSRDLRRRGPLATQVVPVPEARECRIHPLLPRH